MKITNGARKRKLGEFKIGKSRSFYFFSDFLIINQIYKQIIDFFVYVAMTESREVEQVLLKVQSKLTNT